MREIATKNRGQGKKIDRPIYYRSHISQKCKMISQKKFFDQRGMKRVEIYKLVFQDVVIRL